MTLTAHSKQTTHLWLLGGVGLLATPLALATNGEQLMDWGTMGMQLLGGLALFLFGIEQMAEALKVVAGERMKLILARLTTNRFTGALTGAFFTAIIQSSSVTTVLVVGFITAGLMSMSQSIGIIMGANIGTTITAQIIAFKITKAALLMVAGGFGMLFFSKQEKIQHYGQAIMGLGLLFFGMTIMSDAMTPLRDYQPFLDLMMRMENPLIGILVAAFFTSLIQSSSAATGIVIVLASQGFITLPAGIALAFGSNIGTCVTALLAAIGKPREAIRAAVVHVLFNTFGVLIWLGFIDHLASVVTLISPSHETLSGTARLAAETPRQLANAHTLFNLANTLIFIGLTSQFARLVEWLVPDKPLAEVTIISPKYLDDALLDTPALALDRVRLEIGHMGQHVTEMLEKIMPAMISGSAATLKRIAKMDDEVDTLHGQVITYLGNISKNPLTEDQTHKLINLMAAANNLENMGDIIELDMVELGHRRIAEDVTISPETRQILNNLHTVILEATGRTQASIVEDDQEAAREVIALKDEIHRLTDAAALHQARRLVAKEPKRLPAYTIEMDIIEKQKRIFYLARRTAKAALATQNTNGESKEEPKEEAKEG
jgi:phosphate:Na+ symporter